EIYTDPQSRIAMYRRVSAIAGAMVAVMASQIGSTVSRGGAHSTLAGWSVILTIQLLLMAVFGYGIVRLLMVISRLKRSQGKQA
ncbi:MAG TPA: hypothetical protein PLB88_06030, partial [Thermoanaerobaculaceae bacterium]|nr:hypothetical protein [Thermoanaerobaculaceae bacterium]